MEADRTATDLTDVSQPRVLQTTGMPVAQAKLTIGKPDDAYEREADRVADQVMRMPNASPASAPIQRLCPECEDEVQRQPIEEEEEEEETIQAKPAAGPSPAVTADVAGGVTRARSGGRPMSQVARSFFEPRFGHEFSAVRVHTDASAARSARAVNARAYTLGRNIVFGSGEYAPETDRGRTLLAHELTHVIQQGEGRSLR